jgi:FMN phosphatase YigB (HAD superfamily)
VTNRPYDVVTFDCHGTLIDWETGITRAFTAAAARGLGVPVAWINRHGEPVGSAGPPDRIVKDLTGLADWLA